MPILSARTFVMDVEYIDFENIKLPVTVNAIKVLLETYGKDWKIPDPSMVYPKMGPGINILLKDKIGIVR